MSAQTPNHEIEDTAIKWVIEFEKQQGRMATDTRRIGPTDIDSPPFKIEVKAFGVSTRGQDLPFETPQLVEAQSNPNFRLYIVENVRQGDPALFTLRVIEGTLLAEIVKRARERRCYELPLPTADYDKSPVYRLR
jgi:hypothetical protein